MPSKRKITKLRLTKKSKLKLTKRKMRKIKRGGATLDKATQTNKLNELVKGLKQLRLLKQ